MVDSQNRIDTDKKPHISDLKPWLFKPGQSGNPGGRPRNPLKEYSMKEFESWTEEQKKAFLKKIPPIDRWRMTEGNPHQSIDSKVDATLKINVINYGDNDTLPLPAEKLSIETSESSTEIQDSSIS